MTHLSPRAIEGLLAKAIYAGRNGKGCKPWSQRDARHKEPYLLDAKAVLTALEAEGLVVVPKRITDKMIFAVIDATDKKHAPLSCTEFWDVALQAAQGGDDAGQ